MLIFKFEVDIIFLHCTLSTYFLINNYNNTTTLDNEIKITPSLSKSLLIVINVYVICCVYKALDTCCLRTECCLLSDCPGSPHPRWLLITSTVFGVTLNSQTVARSAIPQSLLCTAQRCSSDWNCSVGPAVHFYIVERCSRQCRCRVSTSQRQQKTTNPNTAGITWYSASTFTVRERRDLKESWYSGNSHTARCSNLELQQIRALSLACRHIEHFCESSEIFQLLHLNNWTSLFNIWDISHY